MTKRRFTLLFFLLFSVFSAPTLIRADESEITALTILADPALAAPLSQLASEYSATHHVSVSVVYLPSFEQSLAIEEGESADILITAHPPTLKKLMQQGVLDINSYGALVNSPLVLVGYKTSSALSSPAIINSKWIRQLAREKDFLLAVSMPSASSEGYFSDEWLYQLRTKSGVYLINKIVQTQNAQEISDFIGNSERYGLMFAPEAMQYSHIKILGVAAENIVFASAVVAGNQMKAARNLLKYLQNNYSQRVLMRNGFTPSFQKQKAQE